MVEYISHNGFKILASLFFPFSLNLKNGKIALQLFEDIFRVESEVLVYDFLTIKIQKNFNVYLTSKVTKLCIKPLTIFLSVFMGITEMIQIFTAHNKCDHILSFYLILAESLKGINNNINNF